MLENVASALGAIKQSTPAILLGIAIAAGLCLFLPEHLTSLLALAEPIREYRPHIGFALLTSTCLLIAQGAFAAAGWAKSLLANVDRKRRAAARHAQRLASLTQLTPAEKAYLKRYIDDQTNTIYFQMEDGVAGGLSAKDVIYRSANVGDMLRGVAYNLQPWAREHLNKNPRLLDGAREPESRSDW